MAKNFNQYKKDFHINFALPSRFPEDVEKEVAKFESMKTDASNREDFRKQTVICIDPEGARDHDDAISIVEKSDGYVLGVHIADVSHFVEKNSALDTEAQKRAFTQYLPWAAIPMLPDILSGNLCSLMEGRDRYSFSCIMHLDKKGRVVKYKFVKGIIRVSRSMTYEQAARFLREKDKDITQLSIVASLLKKRRQENGLIEMNSTEYKCAFGKNGEPESIVPRVVIESNSWIEECMLAANKCCALELQARKLNGIYRVHDAPEAEDITELMENNPTLFLDSPIDANKLLTKYKGDNSQDNRVFELYKHLVKKANGNPLVINRILRSMKKAIYGSEPLGHFALHWKDYAHFTSPIRRYADLWCHRELSQKKPKKNSKLKSVCEHLTDTEIQIQKTERKALKLCACYILQDYVGQTFNGEIQGMEEFGLFISVSNKVVALADGLVRMRDIPGDYFIYNEAKKAMIGRKTGKRYKLGDIVQVKLLSVNVARCENDFAIIDNKISKDSKAQKKPEKKIGKKERRFGRK